ncbi:MAG: cytochrome P450 [bacterium]|nr:cytochrome P450 [bacterium]
MSTVPAAAAVRPIPGRRSRIKIDVINQVRALGFLDFAAYMWRTYGDLSMVELGPRKLVFAIHPDQVRHINVTNRQNYDKLGSYENVRKYLLGDGLLTSTGETWRRQRKLMSPFYTPQGIESYTQIMLEDGQKLVERWRTKARDGEEVELSQEMMIVTASIILRAMFTMETDEQIVALKHAVETLIGQAGQRQYTLITLPLWVPTRRNTTYLRAREQVHSFINGIIAQRRAADPATYPPDLLSKLLLAQDDETGATMADHIVRDESITTFFAGHETTARTLTYAFYALAANPEAEARLHEELDRVLGDEPPTLEALKRLPYTLRVIKETLRLYPPAPVYTRDAVADDVIDGMRVEGGSAMMLVPYLTHRHPDFWDQPEVFDPDRWEPEQEKARHPYAFHPFASGQRICIGSNFSLLESHILLAMLARDFRPRLRDGHQVRWEMRGTLNAANGVPVTLVPRR